MSPSLDAEAVAWLVAGGAAALVAVGLWLRQRLERRRADAASRAVGAGRESVSPEPRARLRRGLADTRSVLASRLGVILRRGAVSSEALGELEQLLIESDVGVRTTERLMVALRGLPDERRTAVGVRATLAAQMRALLASEPEPESLPGQPWVVLVVGVNGVGKTTTIGKLARRHRVRGRSVLLVAADTFRAAAADQLAVWAERTDSQIVRQQEGADPSAVVFDGLKAALARRIDVVLVDTAGRLHTKANLMEELRKVRRTAERVVVGAPHEVLLVVDATTGQNAVSQARTFATAVEVSGVVLTKLDGSARGGVVVAVRHEVGLPVRYVGVGEGSEDLLAFDAEAFVAGLLEEGPSDTAGGTGHPLA